MVFVEDIAKVAEQVRKRAELVKGEEATKMGLIIPFLVRLVTIFLIQERLSLSLLRISRLEAQDSFKR